MRNQALRSLGQGQKLHRARLEEALDELQPRQRHLVAAQLPFLVRHLGQELQELPRRGLHQRVRRTLQQPPERPQQPLAAGQGRQEARQRGEVLPQPEQRGQEPRGQAIAALCVRQVLQEAHSKRR